MNALGAGSGRPSTGKQFLILTAVFSMEWRKSAIYVESMAVTRLSSYPQNQGTGIGIALWINSAGLGDPCARHDFPALFQNESAR